MTKKEMENTIAFILEQQAQFSINQENTDKRATRLEGEIVALVNRVGEVAKNQRELTEAQKRTEEKLQQLIEAQGHTEERLNIFINVVERHISEGLNGRQQ